MSLRPLIAALILVAACADDGDVTASDGVGGKADELGDAGAPGGADAGEGELDGGVVVAPDATPEPAVTFGQVWTSILVPRCQGCHGSGSGGLFMQDQGITLGDLIDTGATTGLCNGRTRVVPGDSADSLLFQKVSGIGLCGPRMPLGGPFLSAAETELIRAWIDGGALP